MTNPTDLDKAKERLRAALLRLEQGIEVKLEKAGSSQVVQKEMQHLRQEKADLQTKLGAADNKIQRYRTEIETLKRELDSVIQDMETFVKGAA